MLTTWLQGLNVRDLSSAPVVRAILETKCWGIKLQICRRMLNSERAGAILSLFIPAVWQEHARSSSPFLQIFWDACDFVSNTAFFSSGTVGADPCDVNADPCE